MVSLGEIGEGEREREREGVNNIRVDINFCL